MPPWENSTLDFLVVKYVELIRGKYNIKPEHRGCVATIGTFDGVHLGHVALLKRVKALSDELKLPSLVITFEPQIMEYFVPEKRVPRLMRLREKLEAFQKFGIDRVLCLRFDEHMAQLTAEQFIEEILLKRLGARAVVVGDDFRFGCNRCGDIEMLKQFGKSKGFTAEALGTIMVNGERVSSSCVREALESGDLKRAGRLLGAPFFMSGRVAHGRKQGRILGFPTANIYLHRRAVPVSGIFVVQAYGIGDTPIQGVADVGNRPTLGGDGRSLLEVHFLNFHQDIYGRHIHVEFLKKLREEERYASVELLRQAIAQDVHDARHYFSALG